MASGGHSGSTCLDSILRNPSVLGKMLTLIVGNVRRGVFASLNLSLNDCRFLSSSELRTSVLTRSKGNTHLAFGLRPLIPSKLAERTLSDRTLCLGVGAGSVGVSGRFTSLSRSAWTVLILELRDFRIWTTTSVKRLTTMYGPSH